jgi:hypothetical protein
MKRMDMDGIVGQWTMRAANRYSRRGFMARAGAVMGGVVAAPVLRDAMFPGKGRIRACASEHNQSQPGESIMCYTLNGNDSCVSGQTGCGCWTTCPQQRGVKCTSSSGQQYYISFYDCSRPASSCGCSTNHPRDPWGNTDSCCNYCEWIATGYKVQCRYYGCGSSTC